MVVLASVQPAGELKDEIAVSLMRIPITTSVEATPLGALNVKLAMQAVGLETVLALRKAIAACAPDAASRTASARASLLPAAPGATRTRWVVVYESDQGLPGTFIVIVEDPDVYLPVRGYAKDDAGDLHAVQISVDDSLADLCGRRWSVDDDRCRTCQHWQWSNGEHRQQYKNLLHDLPPPRVIARLRSEERRVG